jgi:hypothetical protein
MNEFFALTLSILSSLLVGVVLVVVPWTTLWDANYLLQPYPALRAVLLNPYARGAVTGLGVLNLVLAVHDAYHHLARDLR